MKIDLVPDEEFLNHLWKNADDFEIKDCNIIITPEMVEKYMIRKREGLLPLASIDVVLDKIDTV